MSTSIGMAEREVAKKEKGKLMNSRKVEKTGGNGESWKKTTN